MSLPGAGADEPDDAARVAHSAVASSTGNRFRIEEARLMKRRSHLLVDALAQLALRARPSASTRAALRHRARATRPAALG
jgi:hypothetical protein